MQDDGNPFPVLNELIEAVTVSARDLAFDADDIDIAREIEQFDLGRRCRRNKSQKRDDSAED
ncbi:hypothetical protein NKH74_27760 [Mesorhizobium sp. M0933]|uniref:hypothetical protein n=1 Tax=Mesorhizobium sp. M0933 TaxID=2957030 RepID=UPI0033359E5D